MSSSQSKIKVGIVGASGYSGEELVRVLARHPHIELCCLASRSLAGQRAVAAMPQFVGLLPQELAFTASDPAQLAASDLDVIFLALPHGVAAEFALPLTKAGKKVIDLSADFRLSSAETYATYYGQEHSCPELLQKAAYVIPEVHTDGWQDCQLVASPGCYPTSIITPLYPLLQQQIIESCNTVIHSISGVSGAGKKAAEPYSFCQRSENFQAYGIPGHRHLSEIEEQLSAAAGKTVIVQFSPHLAPMKRGIASTIVVPAQQHSIEALYAVWEETYGESIFVNCLPSGQFPGTASAVGTNRIDMSAVYDARTKNFVITSAEDNLLKGAGGQAVQIMNLWCGFPETAGLL